MKSVKKILHLSSKGKAPASEPVASNSFGLNLLAEGTDPSIDIVAIHGLDGHWKSSWTDKESGVFWLQDLLPSVLPAARIFSYGYDATTRSTAPTSKKTIYDHAETLVSKLVLERQMTKSERRPIIFIAHSLGGIVLKSALIYSHNKSAVHLPEHRSIKLSTYGVLYLGTPQQGTEGAELATILLNIMSMSMVVKTNSKYYENLKRESEWLQQQCSEYLSISQAFDTKCFYETKEMKILPIWSRLIVPKSSAALPGAVGQEAIAINGDHITIVKFSDKADEGFKTVSSHIILMAQVAPQKVAVVWNMEEEMLNIGNKIMSRPFLVPFGRDIEFVPRFNAAGGEILLGIDKILSNDGVHHRLALAGMGGTGKTGLALEYTYRIHQSSPETSIFWVHASNRARFEKSYREIADALVLPGREDPKINILELVRTWLKRSDVGRWVIVLDNADDGNIFNGSHSSDASASSEVGLSKYLPQSSNGTVLVTTRYKRAALDLCGPGNIVEVPQMTLIEARVLLERHLKGEPALQDEPLRDELLERLGFLPLAIAQAAAYMVYNSISLAKYLERLEEQGSQAKVFSKCFRDLRRDSEVPNSVVATWIISFNQIRRDDEKAAHLLSFMSVIDRQGIPRSLLKQGFDFDEIAFDEALGMLKAFYLLKSELDGETFEMHRLVQLSMKTWLESSEELEQCEEKALHVLAGSFPTGEYGTWKLCAEYLPHADAVLQYSRTDKHSPANEAEIYDRTGWYLHNVGRDEPALEKLTKALDIQEKALGVGHPDTLEVMSKLATVLIRRGKYDEAEAMHRQALKAREVLLGTEHPDTLRSMNNLAIALYRRGKYDEAEAIHRQALKAREVLLGTEHPDTLWSMNNLAIALYRRGKYDEAEAIHRQALKARQVLLGTEHPDTLCSMNNLAIALYRQGKYDEAEAMHRQALKARQALLGTEHPDTLTSMNNLSNVLDNQGKYDEAEAMLRQALKASQGLLGKEHPDTLRSMSNLAIALRMQGKYGEAEAMHRRALKARQVLLGTEHPDTLTSVNILANVLRIQGRYGEAEAMHRQALKAREVLLGTEHPDTLMNMNDLSNVLDNQGKYDEAEAIHRQALKAREALLGTEHPDTLRSMNNLANALDSQGKYDEAEAMHRQALKAREVLLGTEHPDTLCSMNNLAIALYRRGKYDEAEAMHHRAWN